MNASIWQALSIVAVGPITSRTMLGVLISLVLVTGCSGGGADDPGTGSDGSTTSVAAWTADQCRNKEREIGHSLVGFYKSENPDKPAGYWITDTMYKWTHGTDLWKASAKQLREHQCSDAHTSARIFRTFMLSFPPDKVVCAGPEELRQKWLNKTATKGWAAYIDAGEVAAQGTCCDPGYIVTVYGDYGDSAAVIVDPGGSFSYATGYEPGQDATLTHEQFVRYSRVSARQCRKENSG